MKKISLILFLTCTVLIELKSQESDLTKEKWLTDLDFVVTNLKNYHPNLYYRVTEEDFNAGINAAKISITNTQNDFEAFYAIKKVVAMVKDGHTQLFDTGKLGIDTLRYPFRADQFSDGVFITVIGKEYEKYLGAEIIKIDGKPIGDVLNKISQYVNIDNDFGKIRPNTQSLTFANTLFGLGLTYSSKKMNIDLITTDSEKLVLELEARTDKSPILWSNRINQGPVKGEFVNAATVLKENTPLHMKMQTDSTVLFYWFKHLKREKAIYFQYNQVWATQPNAEETWNQFTRRIWEYIDDHEIEKLIIDVRYNDGGNGRTMIPFINEIIKSEQFCNSKNLSVLLGNRTYSASVIFMTELAVHTNATFIGTPPSSPFNFFSDMNVIGYLPNSQAGLGIASRQIDNAWSNQTVYFAPDIPAPMSSADFFSGKDPALFAALHPETFIDIIKVAADSNANAAYKIYRQQLEKYKSLDWWLSRYTGSLENEINGKAYELMGSGEMNKAYQVFMLNTLVFPYSFNVWDSFGEWYYNNNQLENAKLYYQKSIRLNPENTNGDRMIKTIEKELKETDISCFSWLIGRWIERDENANIYTENKIKNDTLIEMLYYGNDSTYSEIKSVGYFYFSNGAAFYNDKSKKLWKANSIDKNEIQFFPQDSSNRRITWERYLKL